MLVRRSYIRAVDLFWARQQVHIVQAADELPVFHQERNFVGSNFQYGAGSFDLAGAVAKAGIEEPA